MTKKETIIATILLIVFGTSMHFVHHVPFFNHFLGCIFPVTESVMAHMKMVFYPMLLLGIYLSLSRRDIREIGAPVLAGLAVMPLIVAVFFSYWIFVRHELMALDMLIYISAGPMGPALAREALYPGEMAALAPRDPADRRRHRRPHLPRSGLDRF